MFAKFFYVLQLVQLRKAGKRFLPKKGRKVLSLKKESDFCLKKERMRDI